MQNSFSSALPCRTTYPEIRTELTPSSTGEIGDILEQTGEVLKHETLLHKILTYNTHSSMSLFEAPERGNIDKLYHWQLCVY